MQIIHSTVFNLTWNNNQLLDKQIVGEMKDIKPIAYSIFRDEPSPGADE